MQHRILQSVACLSTLSFTLQNQAAHAVIIPTLTVVAGSTGGQTEFDQPAGGAGGLLPRFGDAIAPAGGGVANLPAGQVLLEAGNGAPFIGNVGAQIIETPVAGGFNYLAYGVSVGPQINLAPGAGLGIVLLRGRRSAASN